METHRRLIFILMGVGSAPGAAAFNPRACKEIELQDGPVAEFSSTRDSPVTIAISYGAHSQTIEWSS